jgi:hypothetical protein
VVGRSKPGSPTTAAALAQPGAQHQLTQPGHQRQATGELLADGVQPEASIGVVQRPTLSDRHDGDKLRQPGVLDIRNPVS